MYSHTRKNDQFSQAGMAVRGLDSFSTITRHISVVATLDRLIHHVSAEVRKVRSPVNNRSHFRTISVPLESLQLRIFGTVHLSKNTMLVEGWGRMVSA